jgi:hypothetical protein
MDNRIDPSAILREAVELTEKGCYEEALLRHLWFHQHALEHKPAQYGVRLSFALSYWMQLAEAYPPALDALRSIRDTKMDELAGGGGSRHSFNDVVAINDHIGEVPRTAELFRMLDARYPEIAKDCYSSAEDALIGEGEYVLCERYLSDLDAKLESIRDKRECLIECDEESVRDLPPELLRFPEQLFAKDVGQLIEILHCAGRTAEAARVKAWALTVSDSQEVRDVVERLPSAPSAVE